MRNPVLSFCLSAALSLTALACASAPVALPVEARRPASLNEGSVLSTETAMDRFAKTGLTDGNVFHLWDLAALNPKSYESVFNASATPRLEDFRGHRMNGLILYVKYWNVGSFTFNRYTGKVSDLFTGKFYSQPLTFQKRFLDRDNEKGESGINFWPNLSRVSMPMKIYLSPTIGDPATASLKIDYDVESNTPITEQPLLDELKQIPGSDLYLGKMYYRLHGKPVLFLWFALEKADSEFRLVKE